MMSKLEYVDRGEFTCGLCGEMLVDAVSARCGHRFCQTCMDSYQNQQRGKAYIPCPVYTTNSAFASVDACMDIGNGAVFPDYNTRRKMKALRAYCPNRKDGCQEMMESRFVQAHLARSCQYETVPCSFKDVGCAFSSTPQHMDRHCEEEGSRHLALLRDSGGSRLTSVERGLLEMNERLTSEVTALTNRVENLEMSGGQGSSNIYGSITWRVSDYYRAKQEAVLGTKTHIDSPVFYSHQFGYKLCARFYPNGDTSTKRTYASVFIVILRGQYDPVLSWPFSKTVTFTLMDQSSTQWKQDHSESFSADHASDSFKRPRSDMNKATGLPRFVFQDELESPGSNFLENDTLFFKITVHN